MQFGTGSNTERTQKYARVKVQNDIRTSKHYWRASVASETLTGVKMKKSGMFICILVMCLSTNGERA